MFNSFFNDNRMSPEQIIEQAKANGQTPLRVSIVSNGYGSSQSFWEKPKELGGNKDKYPVISLGSESLVGRYAREIAESVQFPYSSAYMHFIGCISGAMVGKFTVEYHGEQQPTSLYVVTSQPPSTGKSAINSRAISPMIAEVERLNEQRAKDRKRILSELKALSIELKQERSQTEMADLYQKKDELEEKLEKLCDITFPISDTTPEGLARINNRQGNFAVISDEATSVNSLLGLTYSSGDRKTNSELVLKAWDAGHVSIARANADNNMSFTALGAISVIAQDETINGIMEAGSRGIGVSERFLLVREDTLLGTRTLIDGNGDSVYSEPSKELKADYYRLVHNLMSEQDVCFTISNQAMRALNIARQELEPHLADGKKFAHTMLRGALGKMDKQVIRIASVLHAINNWTCDNSTPARKEREIGLETMQEAIAMFNELTKTYISAANASGYAGDDAESGALLGIITKAGRNSNSKGRMKLRSLVEEARKIRPFSNQAGVSQRIESGVLPRLEAAGYVCLVKDDVFINPSIL